MRVLVVGSGAREDALSWRLARSESCAAVFAAPGNAGTATRGENWAGVSTIDGKALAKRAREARIDLAVIGPETAIAAGVADRLREAGIVTFGPDRSAGRLESSKVYAKRFMERHNIPTARAAVVHSLDQGRRALAEWRGGCVVKADGLAAGKGVVVADDAPGALGVLETWFSKGVPGGGTDVLLEERLEGREVSVFAIGDGRTFVPFGAACDYKRAGDGDCGPNTGGMGAYSPPAGFPADVELTAQEKIVDAVARGLAADGERYVGLLYCGLMWTKGGPRVIEFNVRFGDPETQVLMPRVEGDFARLLASAARGQVDASAAGFGGTACVGVVVASSAYPVASTPVRGLPADLSLPPDCVAFWGGSAERDGLVDASGGRVLTVSALGSDVSTARANAYSAVSALAARFDRRNELTYRSDIARL